jgi:hypothetical protein
VKILALLEERGRLSNAHVRVEIDVAQQLIDGVGGVGVGRQVRRRCAAKCRPPLARAERQPVALGGGRQHQPEPRDVLDVNAQRAVGVRRREALRRHAPRRRRHSRRLLE